MRGTPTEARSLVRPPIRGLLIPARPLGGVGRVPPVAVAWLVWGAPCRLCEYEGSAMASSMGGSGCPCRRELPAVRGESLPPARGGELGPLGGAPPPEAGPMGKSGGGYWCAPFGLQRAGPREGARYGYRGVIVGEASHPGPAPTPADISGAASSGEVLKYMRPTAGGGIGPSRRGGHRQGKGGRASGSGRRGKSSVGARADPPTPTTPGGRH